MSVNRENVVWQSKDGSWNIGFYAYEEINPDSPDFDYEWDVEYDFSRFFWASTGHRSMEDAIRSWGGANPGGHTEVAYSRKTAKQCTKLDEMVWAMTHPEEARKKRILKARREAAKRFRDTGENIKVGDKLRVRIIATKSSTADYGSIYTETAQQQGDWWGIKVNGKFQRVIKSDYSTCAYGVGGVEVIKPVIRRGTWGAIPRYRTW